MYIICIYIYIIYIIHAVSSYLPRTPRKLPSSHGHRWPIRRSSRCSGSPAAPSSAASAPPSWTFATRWASARRRGGCGEPGRCWGNGMFMGTIIYETNKPYLRIIYNSHIIIYDSVWIHRVLFFHMSYGQYSWLITIKNGASHPMVHRDLLEPL